MSANEQKAHDIFKEWLRDDSGTEALAPRLSAAGLIVTPRQEQALAACEAFAAKYLPMNREYVLDKDVWMQVHDVGRESLEAKKPKERFYIKQGPGNWMVYERLSEAFERVFEKFSVALFRVVNVYHRDPRIRRKR